MTVDIRKALKEKKVTFGSEKVLKSLKTGKIEMIFLAKNCEKRMKETIKRHAKIANVEVVELNEPNDELALICKKPFLVSVISY